MTLNNVQVNMKGGAGTYSDFSFYICNTETTIKKSRQTHFANNKKTSIVCTQLEKRSCYYAASHLPAK